MGQETHSNGSAWQHPLVREITGVLMLKLYLLVAIYHVWFDNPVPQTEAGIESHLIAPDPR